MNIKELKEKIKHLPVPKVTHNNEVFEDITKPFDIESQTDHLISEVEFNAMLEERFKA